MTAFTSIDCNHETKIVGVKQVILLLFILQIVIYNPWAPKSEASPMNNSRENGDGSKRKKEGKIVEIRIREGSDFAYVNHSSLGRTPVETRLEKGDIIQARLLGRMAMYVYRKQDSLTFELQKNKFLVNGKPYGKSITDQNQRIPKEVDSHPITFLGVVQTRFTL